MSDIRKAMGMGWFLRVPLFVGQINVKPVRDSWFSERQGLVPTVVLAGVRFTWKRWS